MLTNLEEHVLEQKVKVSFPFLTREKLSPHCLHTRVSGRILESKSAHFREQCTLHPRLKVNSSSLVFLENIIPQ
jgi:hypothetical protein